MSAREEYSESEWRTLGLAPIAAFHVVAHADGRMSSPELDTFATKVAQVARLTVPQARLAQEIFSAISDDLDEALKRYDQVRRGGMTADVVFAETKALLKTKTDRSEAKTFRDVIQLVITAVAEAAPLVGTKITEQERVAIDEVMAKLR